MPPSVPPPSSTGPLAGQAEFGPLGREQSSKEVAAATGLPDCVVSVISSYNSFLLVAFSSGNAITVLSESKRLKLLCLREQRCCLASSLTLEGHSATVISVCISPDGRMILSGSEDKTIRLWDSRTGMPIKMLKGHTAGVLSLCISPDGSTVASGSAKADSTVRLWNPQTGEEIKKLEGHSDSVTIVRISSDGETVASASEDNTVRLWNVSTGEQIQQLSTPTLQKLQCGECRNTLHNEFSCLALQLSPIFTVASGRTPGGFSLFGPGSCTCPERIEYVYLENAQTGDELKLEESSHLHEVSFSPNGQFVAGRCSHVGPNSVNILRVWHFTSRSKIFDCLLVDDICIISSMQFSSDNTTLVWIEQAPDRRYDTRLASLNLQTEKIQYSPSIATGRGAPQQVKSLFCL